MRRIVSTMYSNEVVPISLEQIKVSVPHIRHTCKK